MEKLTIIKVGGKIVEESDTLNQLLADFSKIPGYKLLVHGGGRSATRIAESLGIESRMVNGRRITDAETLKVVTMVYGGLVNKNIVAGLQAKGVNAIGLTGADMNVIRSVKRPVKQARRFVKQPVKHSVKRRNLDDSGGRGAGVSAVFAKDTLRCWLRSWKRFVSIAAITLLGVAVLTGIYAGCRDAFLAAGRFYDQQGLHDLQVLSTYGLTDDDATALRRIDGVQTVQPERSQTVTTLVDGTKKTVTMQEIGTEGLDQPYLQQGKLPNKAGEVAVTQQFLNDSGLKIGGTITVTPQDTSSSVISVAATETDDSNNADTVGVAANASASDAKSAANTDADAEQSPQFPTKLTITGVVLDPRDLNNPDGYSGMTSFRSTSSEDYTFFAPSDGVTGNIYTAISVAVTGASDFDTFSDAYDEAVKTVADRIEHQIQTTRQKARRQQIVSSACRI